MLTPLQCISLRRIRYNDRHDILTAYSRQQGRVALLVPAASGRTATRIKALTRPLAAFSCMADIRPNRSIFTIRDLAADTLMQSANPLKSTIAIFVADILAALLRESQPDELLFAFIRNATDILDSASPAATANFHICFLMRLQQFTGISPDWSTYRSGRVLDFMDGIFRDAPPIHGRFLPAPQSEFAYLLSRINFRNLHLYRLSHSDRSRILDILITYYNIHFPGLSSVSSLAVLRSLFS